MTVTVLDTVLQTEGVSYVLVMTLPGGSTGEGVPQGCPPPAPYPPLQTLVKIARLAPCTSD